MDRFLEWFYLNSEADTGKLYKIAIGKQKKTMVVAHI